MGFFVGESAVQQPRGAVKLNGTAITGWTRWTVNNNAFAYADEFTVQFVVQGLPADRDANWFSTVGGTLSDADTNMYVELFAGFPDDVDSYSASDLESVIYGRADDIDFDPERGVIEVRGRDLTGVFIDTKTTDKWTNLTASQIATQLAQKHGLTPVVTKTTTKAGKFYQIDYVNLTDERTEWDILCYLAQSENFRVYVKGQSLYFEPYPNQDTADTFVPPWPINWAPADTAGASAAANVMAPKFRRSLTVSRGVQVVVRSWNAKQGRGFTATYPTSKAVTLKPGQSSTSAQIYRLTRPNLTQEQAIRLAQTYYEQLIKHEMRMSFTSPGDNDLDMTRYLQVSGTGTAFDQIYYPESIQRTMSFSGGYSMSVNAKNSSPESQATA
jgi:phage protein D